MNSYGRGEENRKKNTGYFVTRETFGMTLLLFSGILFVIACIGPFIFGEIGVAITAFLLGLCGFYTYPLLLFGIYGSIVMLSGKKLFSGKGILLGTLLAVSVFSIVHQATSAQFVGNGFGAYMAGCWTAAETAASQSTGGGLLFGLIVYPMQALLSQTGAYIVFSACAVVSLFLVLRASPLWKKRKASDSEGTKKGKGEKTFEELPACTTERSHAPQMSETSGGTKNSAPSQNYESPRNSQPPQSYEPPRNSQPPQSYEPPRNSQPPQSYEPPRDYRSTQRYESPRDYQPPVSYEPPRTYTGRDILYGNPANDYKRNLIFSDDSYFNSRATRRSSVEPRREERSAFHPYREEETYQNRYGMQAETPHESSQRRIVEQRPERRESGYTYRDVNYPQRPSYKTPEVPPEPDKPLDSYRNDVDLEDFTSAPNISDLPNSPKESDPFEETEKGEPKQLRRAPKDPVEEPVKSEPNTEEKTRTEALGARRASLEEEPVREDEKPLSREEFRSVFSRSGASAFSGSTGGTSDMGRAKTPLLGRREERLEESRLEQPRFEEPHFEQLPEEEPRSEEPRFEQPPEEESFYTSRNHFGVGFGDKENEEKDSRALKGLRSDADLFDDDKVDEVISRRGTERIDLPVEVPRRRPHVYKPYQTPSMSLFRKYDDRITVPPEEVDRNSSIIVDTLAGFRVDARIVKVTVGPAVTRYDIDIPGNISLGMVTKRSGEIAMRLHARDGVNMYANNEAGTISIEVPNSVRATVGLASVMQAEEYRKDKPGSLMFAIGKDVEGRNVCGDIPKMTHILVAGTTNAGKSVCLNAMLISLICKYSPEDLRIILVDPKKVEFPVYEGLPHLMINEIIADAQKAIMALNWAIKEMERRYDEFEQKTRSGTAVRNIDEYNANRTFDEPKLPRIVIVVDELADLMSVAKKDIEERIQRLTQKARAAGIHLVLATQRPSVDVITGVIKGNLPTRMAVRVIQEVDSRTILDESGAEKLLGMGDMLYKTGGMFNCLRVQGAFISSEEVQAIVEEIKANNEAYFDPEVTDYINRSDGDEDGDEDGDSKGGEGGAVDPMYIQALKMVVKLGSASISLIQRRCSVGYNHAGKIMEWMELMGYVSPFDGKAKARTVLLTKEEFENTYGSID